MVAKLAWSVRLFFQSWAEELVYFGWLFIGYTLYNSHNRTPAPARWYIDGSFEPCMSQLRIPSVAASEKSYPRPLPVLRIWEPIGIYYAMPSNLSGPGNDNLTTNDVLVSYLLTRTRGQLFGFVGAIEDRDGTHLKGVPSSRQIRHNSIIK